MLIGYERLYFIYNLSIYDLQLNTLTTADTIPKSESAIVTIEKHNNYLQFNILTTVDTIPKSESAIVTIEKHNNYLQFKTL